MSKWSERRHRRQEAMVLGCMYQGDHVFTDFEKRIGARPGWLYPTLDRLENRGVIWSIWLDLGTHRARLHYRLTVVPNEVDHG